MVFAVHWSASPSGLPESPPRLSTYPMKEPDSLEQAFLPLRTSGREVAVEDWRVLPTEPDRRRVVALELLGAVGSWRTLTFWTPCQFCQVRRLWLLSVSRISPCWHLYRKEFSWLPFRFSLGQKTNGPRLVSEAVGESLEEGARRNLSTNDAQELR